MYKAFRSFFMCLLVSICSLAKGQILNPVQWSYGSKRINQTEAIVFIKATIDEGWHIYSQFMPEGGPVKTSFSFISSPTYIASGNTQEPKPIKRMEKAFNMEVSFFESSVTFQQKVRIKSKGAVKVRGSIGYMTCNDQKCLPPEQIEFSIPVEAK